MTKDDALRKAMACLRLAKSNNPAEAALAASKAQEIMERFGLDVSSLDYDSNTAKENSEPIMDFSEDPLAWTGGRERTWSLRLASTIARHNLCRVYYAQLRNPIGFKISIVGRPSDVSTVRYIYSFLKGEVERLSKENTRGDSGDYRKQYCLGVVDTISDKLALQKQSTQESVKAEHANNPLALVRVNNAIERMEKQAQAVEAWMESNLRLGKGRVSTAASTWEGINAREKGRKDGHGVRFTTARGGLGRGGTLN